MNSYHPQSLLNELQYYITPPHNCSYLDNKSARMVFLDPAQLLMWSHSQNYHASFAASVRFVLSP